MILFKSSHKRLLWNGIVAGALLASLLVPAYAMATEGSFTVSSLVAETSLAIERDSDGVIVVTVYIDRIKDPGTGGTQAIPGGIGSYSATVTPGAGVSISGVRGVSPYDNPSFDAGSGVFSVSAVANPGQPNNTPVARLVVTLTGNCLTLCNLQVSFQEIRSSTEPLINVPQESPDSLSFQRGDARVDGTVNIVDAMFIAQYTVELRTLSELNGVNASSPRHDTTGDTLSIVDAMFIAQYTVDLRNSDFGLP